MKFLALVPTIALAVGLSVSAPVLAQEMIEVEPDFMVRGVPIAPENVPDFQQKCHLLYLAQMESLASSTDEPEDPLVTGSIGSDNPDPASKDNQLELLASVNAQDCREAGLLN